MGRRPCCSKEGLNRGAWSALEDKILTAYIKAHGQGQWRNLPKRAGLKRCGKSCRLRWLNYLRPDIKRGNISQDEEELIVRLHKLLGNRWSLIAGRLPGRTDNEVKNYWNTNLAKKANAQSTTPHSNKQSPSPTKFRPGKLTTGPPQAPTAATTVIRTKATKCTKVVSLHSPPPPPPPLPPPLPPENQIHPVKVQLDPVQTSLINCYPNQDSLDGSRFVCTGSDHHQEIHGYNKDSSFLDFGFNEFQASEGVALQVMDYDCSNNNLPCDGHGQVQYYHDKSDAAFQDDWNSNIICPEEDNAGLDLESLTFLLDSEEWP